jgi:hypothetical protein
VFREKYGKTAIKDVYRFSPKSIFEAWKRLFIDLTKGK